MPVVGPGHRQEPLHGDWHHDEDGAAQTQPGQYASTINSANVLQGDRLMSDPKKYFVWEVYF